MVLRKIELGIDEKKNIINSITCRKENKFTRLCLFSHFDRDDKIDKYVVFMIKSLFELKFDIVFVTTSEGIQSDELSKINSYLKKIIIKKNIGYDFISWKTGLSAVENYSKYEMILHINDSIFFPLVNPRQMFDTMAKKDVDFWGICDSFTFKYHVESFFWVFNKNIINSDFYNNFWNECKTIHTKSELIKTYEVEFTSLVQKNKFSVSSYIPMQELLDYAAVNFSEYNNISLYQSTPFHSFWEIIIEQFNAPFIKKNILCYGHKDYDIGTQYWEEFINKFTNYDKSLINDNLDRLKKYSNSADNTNFYKNLNILFSFIESIKSEEKFIIYGYGIVGRFIHSILKDNVISIVDKNYKKVNDYHKRYGINLDIKAPESLNELNFDKIIICSFGREEEIEKKLNDKNVKNSDIVKPSKYIFGCISKFSNNITSFAKTLRYIHASNLKRYTKTYIYNASPLVLKYCQEYMRQNNLNPIEAKVGLDENTNGELLFVVKSEIRKNDLFVPFYIEK